MMLLLLIWSSRVWPCGCSTVACPRAVTIEDALAPQPPRRAEHLSASNGTVRRHTPLHRGLTAATTTDLVAVGSAYAESSDMVIIDTDPGIDDAAAILALLGSEEVTVLGVTTVRGNAPVSNVANNVLKVLQVANRTDIPVFKGADFNLIDTPAFDNWFGPDGFFNVSSSVPLKVDSLRSTHAAVFLANTVKGRPGEVTVLAIGPLTNIALAIHLNPELLKQAKQVIILGGSMRGAGNVAPGVEFNFYMDPDSASFVLQKAWSDGVLLTYIPIDTVLDSDLGKEWRFKILAEIKNPAFQFLDKLERAHIKAHSLYTNGYQPSDAYAAAVPLSNKTVLETKSMYGYIENRSERRSRGILIVDYFNETLLNANLCIVTAVNKTVIRQLLLTNLESLN